MTEEAPEKPSLEALLRDIRACTLCADRLPMGPRPVLSAEEGAPLMIVGQAPGRRVHETGIPFNDPSGDRLRDWMGVTRAQFYDPSQCAIIPMGFCFPGVHESGRGDLPPDPECARTWRAPLMAALGTPKLTLVIGQYAQAWHLGKRRKKSLTETVRAFEEYMPNVLPLPHPSPRNNIWMKRNPWFGADILPMLKARVQEILPG